MPGTYAILLAAGRGKRFGGAVPKQYRMLAGRPLLRHAAEALLRSEGLAGVAVAIRPEDRADYESATAGLGLMPPVAGGAERQDSVAAALESLAPLEPDTVLIHDGARPLLEPEVTARVRAALTDWDGAIAALPVTEVNLGLHVGEVFYGNIGSDERLDFTVVGPAVNETSRVVALCRSVDRNVLMTSEFVAATPETERGRIVSVGRFALRGVRRAQELFTLEAEGLLV